jgi:hypothetical protein
MIMKSIKQWEYFPTYDREVWENSVKLYSKVDILNRSVLIAMLSAHARTRGVVAAIPQPFFVSSVACEDYLLRNSVLIYDYKHNALFPLIINVDKPIIDDEVQVPYSWYVSLWDDCASYANQIKYIQKKMMDIAGVSDSLDRSEIIIYKNLRLGSV